MRVQELIVVPSCAERRNERTENTAGPEPKPTDDTFRHAVDHSALRCCLKRKCKSRLQRDLAADEESAQLNGELRTSFSAECRMFLTAGRDSQ